MKCEKKTCDLVKSTRSKILHWYLLKHLLSYKISEDKHCDCKCATIEDGLTKEEVERDCTEKHVGY